MYDKTNIIIMSKLAVYDETLKDKDFYKNQYFRHDFIYRQNMWIRFFTLLGSLILIGFYILHLVAIEKKDLFEMFVSGEHKPELIKIIIFIVGVQVVYTVIGTVIYTAVYEKAQKRLEKYYALLSELDRRKGVTSTSVEEQEEIVTERKPVKRESTAKETPTKRVSDREATARRRVPAKTATEKRVISSKQPPDAKNEDDDWDVIPPPVNVIPGKVAAKRPSGKPAGSGGTLVYKDYYNKNATTKRTTSKQVESRKS